MPDIGKNIKALREAKGITQDALAEALFVTRQTVSNYENGRTRPDVDMLLRIAQVLDTEVSRLYGFPASAAETPRFPLKRLLFCGSLLLALGIGLLILTPIAVRQANTCYDLAPLEVLKLVILPLFLLLLGWTLMDIACFLLKAKPLTQPWAGHARGGLLVLLLLCALLLLPMVLFWCACGLQALRYGSVDMFFPYLPIYTPLEMILEQATRKAPVFYAVIGGALRVFGFPARTIKK